MAETAVKTRDLIVSKITEPSKYKVLLLNDDSTPMEFVIILLMSVFKHTEDSARDITLKVHNEGSGVAGVYNFEIAEQKALDATMIARNNNHPLQIKLEEA